MRVGGWSVGLEDGGDASSGGCRLSAPYEARKLNATSRISRLSDDLAAMCDLTNRPVGWAACSVGLHIAEMVYVGVVLRICPERSTVGTERAGAVPRG